MANIFSTKLYEAIILLNPQQIYKLFLEYNFLMSSCIVCLRIKKIDTFFTSPSFMYLLFRLCYASFHSFSIFTAWFDALLIFLFFLRMLLNCMFNSFTRYGQFTSVPVHSVNRVLIFAQLHSQTLWKEWRRFKYFYCNNALYQVLGVSAKLRKWLLPSSCLSVRPSVRIAQLGSHWMDFRESYIWVFLENLARNFKFIQIWQE
jgi:hypothetical protein